MKTKQINSKEFNEKMDKTLVDMKICTIFSCVIYCAFAGYFTQTAKALWIIGAFLLSLLIWYCGRAFQGFSAKLFKKDKPIYAADKQLKDYIKISESWLSCILAIIVSIVFFAVAYATKQLYYDAVKHETIAHAKGYVFEIVAAVCGFAVTYLSSLTWFLPDERLYSRDTTVISYVIPIAMVVLSTVLFGMPFYVAVIYVIAHLILIYIRYAYIRHFERRVKQMKQYEDDIKDKNRWGE